MAARKSQHASITLVFYLALLVFASLADASSHLHLNNHKRLVKKRAPQLLPDPLSSSSSPSRINTSPSTTDTATLTPTSSPLIIGHSTSSSGSTSSASSASLSSSGISSSATTASNVTSTAVSTSSTQVSSSTSSSSITLPPSSARTLTQTATFTSSSSVASAPPQGTGGASDSKKTTTMVIIIIAASVGGVAIIWTLFRKWKLGRSTRFDERLQPIDWQPPTEGEGPHRRPTSTEAAHNAHGSEHGHGASSDHGHGGRLTPLPDHDFTPLAANPFAAVGTYADLAREHTPRPQMQEAYGAHNPVMTRPAYDVNLPLHHQAGYGGHDGYDYTQYHGRY
ncbi:hypothetical protein JOM56_006389 [Amanita muscaria]